jgi:hypothetical protein
MKRASLGSLFIALLIIPSTASAQGFDAPPTRKTNPNATFAVELRVGPYRPQVDRAFNNAAPYNQVFGDSTRVMLGGEFDWQAIHIPHFGSVGLGGMFGYTKASATALYSDGSGKSAEDTTFSLWMLTALAVIRVDVLARETWIPIVPYGKVGPAMGLWSTSNGSGTSEINGRKGEGRTYGMMYAVGGMFLLDVIDRQAAKTFSAEQGVKHTYAFGEFTMLEVTGLGQTGAMQVGDRTWTVGLAAEF